MKNLICTVLCLALLCCAALPAVAEEQTPLTAAQVIAQLKSNDAVGELWFPVMREGFAFNELEIGADGSYRFLTKPTDITAPNEAPHGWTLVQAAFVTAYNTDARFSPYQTALRKAGAANSLSLSDEAADLLVYERSGVQYIDPNPAPAKRRSISYTYYGIVGSEAWPNCKASGWAYGRWKDGDVVTGSMVEVLVPVSKQYLLSIALMAIGDTTDDGLPRREDGTVDFVAFFMQHLDFRFTTLGDADLNGQVNAVDGLLTLKHAVQKADITDELAFALADWDDDGALDAGDALHTLQKAVGKAR